MLVRLDGLLRHDHGLLGGLSRLRLNHLRLNHLGLSGRCLSNTCRSWGECAVILVPLGFS